MKNKWIVYFFGFSLALISCKSGLVTTSNGCYNLIQSAQAQNRAGDYTDALANFNEVLKKCDAFDAKRGAYGGKAAALNGLRQYNDALAAAQEGLKIDNNNLECLFEKASAELGLGMNTEAKADLQTVVSLTEKNHNTAERATLYAKMAAMDSRQQQYSDGLNNIRQAISLDSGNPDLYILQGDIYSSSGDYHSAIRSYDQAISKGNSNGAAYKGKVEALIKMNQAKYASSNAGTLASKMTSSEKKMLCDAIKSGQAQGMKDMNIDLTQVAICK